MRLTEILIISLVVLLMAGCTKSEVVEKSTSENQTRQLPNTGSLGNITFSNDLAFRLEEVKLFQTPTLAGYQAYTLFWIFNVANLGHYGKSYIISSCNGFLILPSGYQYDKRLMDCRTEKVMPGGSIRFLVDFTISKGIVEGISREELLEGDIKLILETDEGIITYIVNKNQVNSE